MGEKALDALKESKQQLEKAKKLIDRECRIDVLESRIAIVTDFVQARKYEKSDPHKMADMCTAILSRRRPQQQFGLAMRTLFLLSIIFKGNAHDAFDLLQQMRQGNIALHPYLESNLLEQIHKTVGVVLLPDEKGYMPPADEGLVKEEVGEVE